MNYFILSAIQSDICPISLTEDATLYANKEQVNSNFESGYLPWYSYKTSKTCDLPIQGVLVLKNKKIKISIRNINKIFMLLKKYLKIYLKNILIPSLLRLNY